MFFRKYLMLNLFRISTLILRYRFKELIFNTNNLEKILSQKILNKSSLNFAFEKLRINKSTNNIPTKDREIDILFYLRFYPSKGSSSLIELINLLKKKYKIVTFGDMSNISGIIEHGKIPNEYVKKLCAKSKTAFLSNENFFSLFAMDCIENGTKVFFNNKIKHDINLVNEKKVFPVDYHNHNEILKKLETVCE